MAALDQYGSGTRPQVPPASERPRGVALPQLGSGGLAVFRTVWVVAFLVAVVALASGNYRDHVRSSTKPFSHLGLTWYDEDGKIRLNEPWSAQARASGIRRGDTIIAVDGRPVGDDASSAGTLDALLVRPEGTQAMLTVRSAAGSISVHSLTRRKANVDQQFVGTGLTPAAFEWIKRVANVLPDTFLLATAILLLRARGQGTVPLLLSLSLVLLSAVGPGTWAFYLHAPQVRDVLGGLGITSLIAGLLAFPDGRFDPPWSVAGVAIAALVSVVAAFGFEAPWLGVLWSALLLFCVFVMARRYRGIFGAQQRQQVRWVLLGFAWGTIFLTGATLLGLLYQRLPKRSPEALWTGIGEQVVSGLGIGLLALGLLVSLLRYRLYDVDSLISRSAVYGALTGGFVAVFAGSEKLLEAVGEQYFWSGDDGLSGGIAAAVAALVVVPLHSRMHKWAERRFQKNLRHLREDLPTRIRDLRDTEPMTQLAPEVLSSIVQCIHARHAAILISDRVEASAGVLGREVRRWLTEADLDKSAGDLDCRPDDPLFPIRLPLRTRHRECAEPIGWVLLGPRPDGSLYGSDEREALAELAGPIGRAVRIVQLREEREATLAALVERRVGHLERKLRRLMESHIHAAN